MKINWKRVKPFIIDAILGLFIMGVPLIELIFKKHWDEYFISLGIMMIYLRMLSLHMQMNELYDDNTMVIGMQKKAMDVSHAEIVAHNAQITEILKLNGELIASLAQEVETKSTKPKVLN
jgi:hypothetical protein